MVLSVMISSVAISVGQLNRTTTRERADFASARPIRKFASLCELKSVVVACELLYFACNDFACEWPVTGMESIGLDKLIFCSY